MNSKQESIMKRIIKHVAPWLAAAAIGGAIALAPIASADTDPAAPNGTNPTSPYILGYHASHRDDADTTFCFIALPIWCTAGSRAASQPSASTGLFGGL